jgi:hypothetical protein
VRTRQSQSFNKIASASPYSNARIDQQSTLMNATTANHLLAESFDLSRSLQESREPASKIGKRKQQQETAQSALLL